jgi:carboxyl-terminal processing protease
VERLPGLGCQAERQRVEVGLIGCDAVKARVWTSAVIKVEIVTDRSTRLADADIITHLDDGAIQGRTLNQAVDKMRGPVNTKIKLKILRNGVDKRDDSGALCSWPHRRR